MLTRRHFLRLVQAGAGAGALASTWALAEPFWLRVTRYAISPPGWPAGLALRVAVVADVHACEPWMSAGHIEDIVDTTNALGADCVLLLGDYLATHRFALQTPPAQWARALGRLRAPLGVHAVLGNHDWWSDPAALATGAAPFARKALEDAHVRVFENDAVRLVKDGRPFWIAGLGDQIAFVPRRGWRRPFGMDDLAGTLHAVSDDAPVILMAHEPDVFPRVPPRVSLTLCGHTHGGQVNILGHAPWTPSRYGARFRYGHVVEENRHLVVSGGLGCSGAPVRLGSPPEIVLIELGASSIA
ncbi:MAG: metallophosphoesterase [Hyphomicrobiales bacterium]|nr:metallophosphoesterase [Hyphomicrobiales bacterium]